VLALDGTPDGEGGYRFFRIRGHGIIALSSVLAYSGFADRYQRFGRVGVRVTWKSADNSRIWPQKVARPRDRNPSRLYPDRQAQGTLRRSKTLTRRVLDARLGMGGRPTAPSLPKLGGDVTVCSITQAQTWTHIEPTADLSVALGGSNARLIDAGRNTTTLFESGQASGPSGRFRRAQNR